MVLYHYNYKGELLQKSPVAAGKHFGNKRAKGDMKTPEGVFQAVRVEDATNWTHDFNDGHGNIKGAYGPYFVRLDVPGTKGIGIHGTHDNMSIGRRASEGCIRLKNGDLENIVKKMVLPVVVVITRGVPDLLENKIIADSLALRPAKSANLPLLALQRKRGKQGN